MVREFVNFVFDAWGNGKTLANKIPETPNLSEAHRHERVRCDVFQQKENTLNNAMFEEKWKQIRSQSTQWWSLMAEYDLLKVDKADAKFDKFTSMLQVKYGFTRQKAKDEVGRLWKEYESKNTDNT
jgi:hypothetical protein